MQEKLYYYFLRREGAYEGEGNFRGAIVCPETNLANISKYFCFYLLRLKTKYIIYTKNVLIFKD
ncbi:hypothetical protein BEH94_04000 [Candidatus Altiarchaeales archaeon WOR_SM1_SCG]|nr:hypothetical protein BEH94_04000 [Candidatus Altiarchaeales archaeon WOR_SM1_SCG]